MKIELDIPDFVPPERIIHIRSVRFRNHIFSIRWRICRNTGRNNHEKDIVISWQRLCFAGGQHIKTNLENHRRSVLRYFGGFIGLYGHKAGLRGRNYKHDRNTFRNVGVRRKCWWVRVGHGWDSRHRIYRIRRKRF